MRRIAWLALVAFAPASLLAQKQGAKACAFDTVAHTDMLTLDFSLRAFRDDDSLPDPGLTRGFGDMLRSRFKPPATIGQLLYPNTYYPKLATRGFEAIFGTLQFDLSADGKLLTQQWFAAGPDSATDDALEQALKAAVDTDEPRDLASALGWTGPSPVRLQFLITQDSALHAPLARLRAPMLRIESGGERLMVNNPLVPRSAVVVRAPGPRTEFELIVNAKGLPDQSSIQVVVAPSFDAAREAMAWTMTRQWAPFLVGKCPVSYRIHVVAR